MTNTEKKSLYQKIKDAYNSGLKSNAFLEKKNEEAFMGLARIYLGRNIDGKKSKELARLAKRKEVGEEYFARKTKEDISQETKTLMAQLYEVFEDYIAQASLKQQKRIAKTINGQIAKWQRKYSPETRSKLHELAMTYQGLNFGGEKSKELFSVEKRYEKGNEILLKLRNLNEEDKKAASELYNIFKAYDQRDYNRRTSKGFTGKGRDTRTRELDAKRDALRIQHASLMNHTLEGIVREDKEKVEPALERLVPDSNKKTEKTGFLTYLGNVIKKPFGKIAAVGVAAIAAGLIWYGASNIPGCGKKTETRPIVREVTVEQTVKGVQKPEVKEALPQRPERERFTPDPFKPFIEAETTAKAKEKAEEKTRCIDWQRSKLEQGIRSYKLDKDTLKVKLNKYLADAMRNDPNVVLRFIGDNKLYETNKIGPNNEITLKGVTYKTGASFGIIRKTGGVCGDYLASLRLSKPKTAEAKTITPLEKPKIKQAPEKVKPKVERRVIKPEKAKPSKPEVQVKKDITTKIVKTPEVSVQDEYKAGIKFMQKLDMQYRKVWGLRGNYDYLQNFEKKEVISLYNELKQAFMEQDVENMFMNMTLRSEKVVPKLVVEFSNKGEESRLERMLERYDSNNPDKKVAQMNFSDREQGFGYGKKEKFGYEILIPLSGLKPEEKAKLATAKIFEKLNEMREKNHFDTYFFNRDVKSQDKNAKAPIQGHIFVSQGSKKMLGAIFTPYKTDVQFVSDKKQASFEERMDNDTIQIGESIEEKAGISGGNGADGGAGGTGAGGGVGGGAM